MRSGSRITAHVLTTAAACGAVMITSQASVAAPTLGLPACPAGSGSSTMSAPDEVAVGRPWRYEMSEWAGRTVFSLLPAEGALRLRNQFAAKEVRAGTATFAAGDGPAILSAATEEVSYGSAVPCEAVLSKTVTPVEPDRLTISNETVSLYDYAYTGLKASVEYPNACETTAYKPITVTLTARGERRRSWTLSDPCGTWTGSQRPDRSISPQLIGWHDPDASEEYSRASVEIRPRLLRRNQRRTYRMVFTSGKQRLRTVRFRVVWSYSRSERIWEFTDDFVNYCINQGRSIYSENGRLYCAVPAQRTGRLKVLT